MGMTPQYFHTIPTSCAISPTMPCVCYLCTTKAIQNFNYKKQNTTFTVDPVSIIAKLIEKESKCHTSPAYTAHELCIFSMLQDRVGHKDKNGN